MKKDYNSIRKLSKWGMLTIYNYNGLWKQLIDKKITKTEMRKMARISTNILAKMGKDEPVSMESLAKICTVLKCGLDDIVEIRSDDENTFTSESGKK
jgi:Predicted transcriptional regulator